MFARAAAFFALALPLAANGYAIARRHNGGCNNTGKVDCCNSIQSSKDPNVSALLGLLNLPIGPADIPVGLTCNQIPIIGLSGTDCASQPVCCENNSFNGVVALGCSPINVGL